VVPLELPAYQRKENWGAARPSTSPGARPAARARAGQPSASASEARRPSCNLLGPTALGFRCRDDITEVTGCSSARRRRQRRRAGWRLAADLPACRRPTSTSCSTRRSPTTAARWLERTFGSRHADVPIGVGATRDFLARWRSSPASIRRPASTAQTSRLPWYSRSVDSTYLTGKRVFIFGDATHAIAAARVATEELGFEVVGLGTYSREFARDVRAAAEKYGVEALITDDYLEVEAPSPGSRPSWCSAPRWSATSPSAWASLRGDLRAGARAGLPGPLLPADGVRGRQRLFDTWVHPLMMGLEEHLLGMFREDFEFHDEAAPSHLGRRRERGAVLKQGAEPPRADPPRRRMPSDDELVWDMDAERRAEENPFFVRGKARRNTERFAAEQGHQRRSPSRLCTMPKPTSAADKTARQSSSSRWTAIWPAPSSARGPCCGATCPGLAN
jgi:light-independent protochlorophyllide reductase subunit B